MKNICKIMLIGLVIFIGMSMLGGEAYAGPVCYILSSFPSERLKLVIKSQGALSTSAEANEFLQANQKAYSVVGKEVGTCGGGTMVPVIGAIITGKSNTVGVEIGAHMGLRTTTVRTLCSPIRFECTTTETSEKPSTWSCFWATEGGAAAAITLTKVVDEKADPLCIVFEDGGGLGLALTEVQAEGASGLMP